MDELSYPGVPNWLLIPPCTLEFGTQYKLNLVSKMSGETPGPLEITLNVQEPVFTTVISGGGGDHPISLPLSLSATIIPEGTCEVDYSRYEYQWDCEVVELGQASIPCADPDGIFGSFGDNNEIEIPTSSLTEDKNIKISLQTKIGIFTVSSSAITAIKGPSVIPYEIVCLSERCSKFSTQYL